MRDDPPMRDRPMRDRPVSDPPVRHARYGDPPVPTARHGSIGPGHGVRARDHRTPLVLATVALALPLAGSFTPARPGPDPSQAPARAAQPAAPVAPVHLAFATIAPTAPTPVGGTPAPTPPAPTPPQPITIAVAGDVHFEPPIRQRLADPGTALSGVRAMMAGSDLAMVNLETAITTRGRPEPKAFTFRAPPSALTALERAGVDVVTVANNHGVDFGRQGLTDTLAHLDRSRLAHVGIGRTASEAYRPHVATVKGRRVAIFGITQVIDTEFENTWTATATRPGLAWTGNLARLTEGIRRVRGQVDTVLVFVHWGVERQHCPTSAQQQLAATLTRAGADVVVGSHAHRLQGFGTFRAGASSAFVAYGLGNFVFYAGDPEGTDTGVLQLTVDGRRVTRATWTPARIGAGVPTRLRGDAAAAARARMSRYQTCTGLH